MADLAAAARFSHRSGIDHRALDHAAPEQHPAADAARAGGLGLQAPGRFERRARSPGERFAARRGARGGAAQPPELALRDEGGDRGDRPRRRPPARALPHHARHDRGGGAAARPLRHGDRHDRDLRLPGPDRRQPAAARPRHLGGPLQHRLRYRHRGPRAHLLPALPQQDRHLCGGDGAAGVEARRHRPRRARRFRRRAAMNFQRGREREPLEINLVPLIDVMMVILIFLMITTTYSKYTELQINLPTASAEKQPERPNEIAVLVNAQGQYVINRNPVPFKSVEQLADELRRAGGALKDPVIVISADAAATHQSVVRVMEAARIAGLWQRSLAFGFLVLLRKLLYRLRILKSSHPGIPVVVVGNLTAGGSGKTPLVLLVAELLTARGWAAAVLFPRYCGAGG